MIHDEAAHAIAWAVFVCMKYNLSDHAGFSISGGEILMDYVD